MLKLTLEEISKHHSAEDCWIIIDGQVYDLTSWAKEHPGGNVLTVLAGEDASALVHSSHFENVIPRLQRFRIGSVQNYDSHFTKYNDEFLLTLKSRVQSYFAEQQIDCSSVRSNYFQLVVMALFYFILWFCMYLFPPWGLLAAVPLGFLTCSFIGSFGHEHIHNNLIRKIKSHGRIYQTLNNLAWGIFIPTMPQAYFQYEHFKHHGYPMSPEEDYDIYALKDFVRLSPKLKKRDYQTYQHLYAPLIYGFYILLQIRGGYVSHFFKKRKLLFDPGVLLNLVITAVVSISFHVLLPIYITSFSWFVLCELTYMLTWQSAIYISSGVPHMTDVAPLLNTDSLNTDSKGSNKNSWAFYVCQTTKNLKCGHWFFDWLTGGLNYHIEHHLLPFISREHLSKIQPIVEQTCREFGYPYRIYSSFRHFYRDHYRFLFELGRSIQ